MRGVGGAPGGVAARAAVQLLLARHQFHSPSLPAETAGAAADPFRYCRLASVVVSHGMPR